MYGLDDMNLDELYDMKRNMENNMEKYVGDDSSFHTGDRGYQEMLVDLVEVEEEIEKRETSNENKNNLRYMKKGTKKLQRFEQFGAEEEIEMDVERLNKLIDMSTPLLSEIVEILKHGEHRVTSVEMVDRIKEAIFNLNTLRTMYAPHIEDQLRRKK